ncbi:MAG TPA: diacylglycerol kinase [Gemmatales bacterium]|nr:diacylglycerol kinase [Gemmatales bacterium]
MEVKSSKKPKFTWLGKFHVACRGVVWGIFGQTSFYVHLPVAVLTVLLAAFLQFDAWRWVVLLLTIGMVLSVELLNSSLERLFHGLPEAWQEKCWPALDIAAGAVLVASITAIIVGLILFIPPILAYFG